MFLYKYDIELCQTERIRVSPFDIGLLYKLCQKEREDFILFLYKNYVKSKRRNNKKRVRINFNYIK